MSRKTSKMKNSRKNENSQSSASKWVYFLSLLILMIIGGIIVSRRGDRLLQPDVLNTESTDRLEGSPTIVVESSSLTDVFDYTNKKITVSNASHVSQLKRIGNGEINKIAYSPDGETIAVATTIGIFLHNSRNLEMQSHLADDNYITSLAFSPDGQVLASGSYDGTIRLWRIADGSLLRTLEEHTHLVESVAFSPDGQILASGADDRTIRLWQAADGSLLRTLEGHTDDVMSVTFSPDGQVLASG